jgi:hypothetical protein
VSGSSMHSDGVPYKLPQVAKRAQDVETGAKLLGQTEGWSQRLPFTKSMQKIAPGSLQGSYTSLSALNRSKQSNKEDSLLLKPKIPFAATPSEDAKKILPPPKDTIENRGTDALNKGTGPNEREQEFKWRFANKELNRTMDGLSLAEKLATKKAELAEKIKVAVYVDQVIGRRLRGGGGVEGVREVLFVGCALGRGRHH